MDRDFQTTFIPKKPLTQTPSEQRRQEATRGKRPVGLFTVLTTFLFFLALRASVGTYLYGNYIDDRIVSKRNEIQRAEQLISPTFISDLQKLDERLIASKNLLNQHPSLVSIYGLLSDLVIPDIEFNSLAYVDAEGNGSLFTLKGSAPDFVTIAQQSQVLGESEHVRDHFFSNFSDTEDGKTFTLELVTTTDFVRYMASQ